MRPSRGQRLALLFLLIWVLLTGNALAAESFSLLIIKSQDMPVYNEAITGVLDYLKESGQIAGKDVKVTQINLEKHLTGLDGLRRANPKLVVAVGTKAAKLIKTSMPEIPLVFVMVYDAVKNRILDENGVATRTITGVTAEVAMSQHLDYVSTILPEKKRIGLLYDKKISARFVADAEAQANKRDMRIRSIDVSNTTELPAALKELEKNINVFWMIEDPTVTSKEIRQEVMLFWLKRNVPIIGTGAMYVKAGALYCITANSYEMGKQAGKLCGKIMDGSSPETLPVETPAILDVTYNKNTAQTLGITLPADIAKTAKNVAN